MLMITDSRPLAGLPFDRAMPCNSHDLMIMISPSIAFRLAHVSNEMGKVFDLTNVHDNNPKVFGEVKLKDRIDEFQKHFISKIDRYFYTKKSQYIFFDTEEQSFIRKSLSTAGVSCGVDVLMIHTNGKFEQVNYRNLKGKKGMTIVKFLANCNVREVLNPLNVYRSDMYSDGARASYKPNMNMKSTGDIFEEYPMYTKLREIKSKKSFKQYEKNLRIKYHPDRCKDKDIDATEISQIISNDFDKIKRSGWYISLPEVPKEDLDDVKENTDKGGEQEGDNSRSNGDGKEAI